MEIAEFLLARIAEDEAVARAAGVSPDPEQWALWVLDDDYRHDTVCVSASRVLAECEAKRRLVELAVESDHGFERPEPWGFGVLHLLALPYAEHSDYDRAWAPLDAHAR